MSNRVTKPVSILIITLILILSFLIAANNQTFNGVQAKPTLSLSYYKNNGYGLGNDISGVWIINAAVSQDVSSVAFYMDDQLQDNDTSSPFSWTFNTDNYTLGVHTIRVTADDSLGETESVEVQRNFVGFPTDLVVGIISLVVVILVVAIVISVYKIKKNKRNTE